MSESQTSYRGILKASSLIGGASVVNILIGMVRTKFVAVLLGTSGAGLIGMYMTITGIVATVSGMGVNSSGVRQIAEAYGSGDEAALSRTVTAMRRLVWVTGCLGMVFMAAFCLPLSRLSFKTGEYAVPLAFLGVSILLGNVAVGQGCLIQGTRRIADMARISIVGSFSGTVIGVPLYWWLGQRGIVPSLVLAAAATLATSWWFARRVPVQPIVLPWRDCFSELWKLLRFGVALMGASLVSCASTYLISLLLVRKIGLSGLGIYQSAFSLSGVLVTFVLGAMAADYYPRLTGVASDNRQVLAIMNDQTEVALLLALPGLAAMHVFSPLLIRIFYAPEFAQAVEPLRWFCFGLLGRVLAWPMGFIMLAKARGTLFFVTELVSTVLLCALTWLGVSLWGVAGTGVAFFSLYVFYLALMALVSRALVGGVWRKETALLAGLGVAVMTLLMATVAWVKEPVAQWCVGLALLAVSAAFCLKKLCEKTGITPKRFYESLRGRLAAE